MLGSFLVLISGTLISGQYYDTFTGKPITRARFEQLSRYQLVPYCAIEVAPCDPNEMRRMDASCNNLRHPQRGTTYTPYRRMMTPMFSADYGLRTSLSGKPLPLARPLRVAVMSDGRVASDRFTMNVVNYNIFVTADITSVHDTVNYVALTTTCCEPEFRNDPRCIPIEVPADDLHLRTSDVRCMNLTRSISYQRLGCVPETFPPERVNSVTPMLDLSIIYGTEEDRARLGREFRGGRLRAEVLGGKEWPPSGGAVCVNNVPPAETRCHDTPSASTNAVLGINLLSLWFYRNHNYIAGHLQKLNPCWNDDKLYYTAREINIALYLNIFYYELLPVMLGWDFLLENQIVFPTFGHVEDYDPSLEPRVSIDYVASTRWFHTIQEGRAKLYTKHGHFYGEVSVVDFNLRTGALVNNNTIQGMTQGTFRQPTGAVDKLIDPDMGERVLGRLQFALDVMSADVLKGRDVGLPPYNHYRRLCALPEATTFDDLREWMDQDHVDAISSFYEHPSDIDLLVGITGERAMPHAIMGPTLACIMAEQLQRWRRADRFWYENTAHPGAFTAEQLREIRKMTLSKLTCQHGDGVDAVQPYAFIIPGHGNEITSCSEYEMPNLDVFRDDKCYHDTSGHYPGTSRHYPDTSGHYPGTAGHYPGTSGHYPDGYQRGYRTPAKFDRNDIYVKDSAISPNQNNLKIHGKDVANQDYSQNDGKDSAVLSSQEYSRKDSISRHKKGIRYGYSYELSGNYGQSHYNPFRAYL